MIYMKTNCFACFTNLYNFFLQTKPRVDFQGEASASAQIVFAKKESDNNNFSSKSSEENGEDNEEIFQEIHIEKNSKVTFTNQFPDFKKNNEDISVEPLNKALTEQSPSLEVLTKSPKTISKKITQNAGRGKIWRIPEIKKSLESLPLESRIYSIGFIANDDKIIALNTIVEENKKEDFPRLQSPAPELLKIYSVGFVVCGHPNNTISSTKIKKNIGEGKIWRLVSSNFDSIQK